MRAPEIHSPSSTPPVDAPVPGPALVPSLPPLGLEDRSARPPSPDLVSAFARAVAAGPGRALLLSEHNGAVAWVPLGEALQAGSAFAVSPREDLVCFDFDASEAPADAEARGEALDALAARFPVVVTASGRPGHRHVFWPTADLPGPEVDAALAALAAAGLRPRRGAIRPPLSPHRAGLPVALVHPADPAEALARLEPAPRSPVRLSARMRRILREGHTAGGYPSASHARMALACAAVGAGARPRWLRMVLEDPANALGETFRARPAHWRSAEVTRLYDKAVAFLAAPGASPVPPGARAAHRLSEFAGRAGATDLAVLEGLVTIADRCGRNPLGASLDEVAIAAGIHRTTARRSLRRLCAAGWLVVQAPPSATCSTTWAITVPDRVRDSVVPDAGPPPRSVDADLGADPARWGALGKSRARVLRELSRDPTATAEVAATLGLAAGTVRRHLSILRRAGLADLTDEGWVRTATPATTVAAASGTLGARDRQEWSYRQARAVRRRSRTAPARPVR